MIAGLCKVCLGNYWHIGNFSAIPPPVSDRCRSRSARSVVDAATIGKPKSICHSHATKCCKSRMEDGKWRLRCIKVKVRTAMRRSPTSTTLRHCKHIAASLQAPYSSATCRINLPKFFPSKSISSVSGKLSKPWAMSSRVWNLPWLIHLPISATASP